MKKNKILIGVIIIIVLVLIIAVFIYSNNNNGNANNKNTNIENTSNITTSRISTNVNEEQAKNRIANILQNQNEIIKNTSTAKEISTYSTTIKDKSSGRLTNISITCSTLNNTIIHSGETFSFNKVVGKPTAERGYQEASVIIDHKTEKGIGGGNCQVSSTLYNAVLAVPSLVVTERHAHSKSVPYVSKGKDAAVAYGSYDFKFRNNSGNDIKINCSTDGKSVTTTLISLEQIGMQ